eukprot:4185789-Prymnesium_polylepis.1
MGHGTWTLTGHGASHPCSSPGMTPSMCAFGRRCCRAPSHEPPPEVLASASPQAVSRNWATSPTKVVPTAMHPCEEWSRHNALTTLCPLNLT